MPFKYFVVLSFNVGAGSQQTQNFVPTEDVLVERIYATERGGQSLLRVFADIDFEGTDITRGNIPLTILGHNYETAFRLGLVLHKGNAITFTIVNTSGSAVNVDITLECHTPTG